MKPVRIQRKRTKGWRMPENTVYVGRGSKWENPYMVTKANGIHSKYKVELVYTQGIHYCFNTKKEAIEFAIINFKILFACKEFRNDYPTIEEIIAELKGKNLACWCPLDQPCHADVLLELANQEQI